MNEMPVMLSIGEKWERKIPFSLLNEKQAEINHGQSLQELARRGGLSPCEAIAIIDKRRWLPIPREEGLAILETILDKG
jgi:hypothetical protein